MAAVEAEDPAPLPMDEEDGLEQAQVALDHVKARDFAKAFTTYQEIIPRMIVRYGEDSPELGRIFLGYGIALLREHQATEDATLLNESAVQKDVEATDEANEEDEDWNSVKNAKFAAFAMFQKAKEALRGDEARVKYFVSACNALGEVLMEMANMELAQKEYAEAADALERMQPNSVALATAYSCQALAHRFDKVDETRSLAAKALAILLQDEQANAERISDIKELIEDCEVDFDALKKVAKNMMVGTHSVATSTEQFKRKGDEQVNQLQPKKKRKIAPSNPNA